MGANGDLRRVIVIFGARESEWYERFELKALEISSSAADLIDT